MSWPVLVALVLALGLAFLVALSRRIELARMERKVGLRDQAVRTGTAEPKLSHPVVDLSRCLGCGTCVAACPEDHVLELVHGQAMVVNGGRCQGISACERECPVGAIKVTIANLDQRTDVPVLTDDLEAVGSPGLFLAGEVTAHALIKTAIEHGKAVGSEVARRVAERGTSGGAAPAPEPRAPLPSATAPSAATFHGGSSAGSSGGGVAVAAEPGTAAETRVRTSAGAAVAPATYDLVVVGAGPAGLACSLEAKRHGLRFVTLDQEASAGGTVAKYPRRKLVMTQPVELPLHGKMKRTSYSKEELMELWGSIVEREQLPIHGGETFQDLERRSDGRFLVRTQKAEYLADHVCLALGRRGSPRKLGVPGEDLPKVAYSLLDANSYTGRRVLVVGGGDSAVETALGLAEQEGNQVTLSYRKDSFSRIRSRNAQKLERALHDGRLEVRYRSELRAVYPDSVELTVQGGEAPERLVLPNDDVFVMAGGVPPFQMLERAGVSFDPNLRPAVAPIAEQGTGLVRALGAGFALALAALIWALFNADYYLLPMEARPAHGKHVFLRPGLNLGLAFGIAALAMIVVNLLYLVRRAPRPRLPVYRLGSLQTWMTSHVATGILAFLCALMHAAMAPRDTVGGHALWGLLALLLTGAVGRYFYAYVPRATNGRELELDEVKRRLHRLSEEWDRGQVKLGERVRDEVLGLVHRRQWKSSFLGRALSLVLGQRELRKMLARLEAEARAEGIGEDHVEETMQLARKAHRIAMTAAHYEDLRAVASTWRYMHRWAAALTVLLVIVHVVYALTYGAHFFDGGGGL